MQKSPPLHRIRQWLAKQNPLGLFTKKRFSIRDIDPKPWSGHFNYLVTVGSKKFVLRFKGPEWGSPQGIEDEFEILRAVQKHRVGPKAFYLAKDFFGEPMTLIEHLEGKPLTAFSYDEQKKLFPGVARFIAKINAIPFPEKVFSARERLMNYLRHKETWALRLEVILRDPRTRAQGREIKKLIPRAEAMLEKFENRLRRALKKTKPSFIFESAHLGHCMRVRGGFRFVNWEEVALGDPSFTLGVFLASIESRADFEEVKKIMIREYLKRDPVPQFRELVDYRLKERAISNTLWRLWAPIKHGESGKEIIIQDLAKAFKRIEEILKREGV